jgi:hypothetical protein
MQKERDSLITERVRKMTLCIGTSAVRMAEGETG